MEWLAAGAALAWSAALVRADIRERRLPNALTVPGAVVILMVAGLVGKGAGALCGGFALTAIYLLVHLISPAAMGAGDIKLALGVGALTGSIGVAVWALAAVTAPLITAVVGAVSTVRGRGLTVPHGPSMCCASLLAAAPALL